MKTLLATIILALAAPAAAQPYLYLAPSASTVQAAGISDSSSAPYIAAGWQFGAVALEASHVDTGSASGASRTWSASGPGLAVLGTVPIGAKFSLLGKLGAYWLNSERMDVGPPRTSATVTRAELGARPAIGIGVLYARHPRLQLRAMLEQVDGTGELERLRLVTVGAVVVFP